MTSREQARASFPEKLSLSVLRIGGFKPDDGKMFTLPDAVTLDDQQRKALDILCEDHGYDWRLASDVS